MKKWMAGMCLLVMAIMPAISVSAQDAPEKNDDAKKTEAKPAAKDGVHKVAFRNEGLLFCDVTVNGKGPYNFLFDSGASISVLNEKVAKTLELELHDMPGGGISGVGTQEAKMAVIDSIHVGGFEKGKSAVAVMNLDHISGSLGKHMDGIIGQNVIKIIKETRIDFAANEFTFTDYPEGKRPADQQESMIIRMLEGGGMGGMPGMPGLPGGGGDDEEPEEDDGEEDFSYFMNPTVGLLQDGGKTEARPARRHPTVEQSMDYTTVGLDMLGRKMELSSYWYIKGTINGVEKTFMFDTGASALAVINPELAEEIGAVTSFGYPVKGVGEAEAKETILDSLAFGNLSEKDVPASVMKLPKMSEQMGAGMGAMLKRVLEMQGIQIDFDGIVGLPLATRYKVLTVNTENKTIKFTPWDQYATPKVDPYASDDMMGEAAIRTWNGHAGKIAIKGDSVKLDDWEKHGLEHGGLIIEEVTEGSTAHKAGIQKGDILISIADVSGESQPVNGQPTVVILGCLADIGEELVLTIKRGDEVKEFKVKTEAYGWTGDFPERFKRESK